MEQENDIINRYIKKQQTKEESITLAALKIQANKNNDDKKKEARVNFKNFYSDDRYDKKEDQLQQYYCSICGKFILATNVKLENLPQRQTDQAIAVDMSKVFVKHFLKKDGVRYFKREEGVEQQFKWKCDCNSPIGYQSISFEEAEKLYEEQYIKKTSAENQINELVFSNKPFLYIINDSIVLNANYSRLMVELQKLYPEIKF